MLVLLRRLLLMLVQPKKALLPVLLPILLGFLSGAFLFSANRHHFYQTPLYWRTTSNGIGIQAIAGKTESRIDKNLLLVGVMTAKRFLDTRALEIWRTWAQRIPGRVIFFISEGTPISEQIQREKMPIVVLRGVSDTYPPQKKSFAMLRWLYDNQLANYRWFMRADDDLYVRMDKLNDFLLSLDPNKAHLLGQAGLGNSAEYGQLALGMHENYCMGGPGVILSRETLRQLAPHLQSCLGNLLTSHEDVEIGRRHVGLACPWNYEMQTLFHNNASIAALYSGPTPLRSPLPIRRLITLHPVKQPEAMRRIHCQVEIIKIKQLRQKRMGLVERLEEIEKKRLFLEKEYRRVGEAAQQQGMEQAPFSGLIPEFVKNSTEDDTPIWEFISADSKLIFCTGRPNCPRHTFEAEWRRALNTLFDQFNGEARAKDRTMHFQTLQYGFVRIRPRFGVDFILDMALNYRRFRGPHRTPLTVRRHAYVQKRFGPLRARILPKQGVNERTVHIVVALKGRAATFARFANNLVELSRLDRAIQLTIVHYSTEIAAEEALVNASLAKLAQHLPVQLIYMPSGSNFSRGEALSAGAALLPLDALLFFADVDVLIRADALHRVRMNTHRGKQVYFPIVFSEFSPKTWRPKADLQMQQLLDEENNNHFVYGQRRGYFRHFGYGIVAIFRQDFDTVGGFNLTIQGWGFEDVDLFERVVKAPPALQIFRAPDPGLVHVFHPIECGGGGPEQSEKQREACEGTRAQSLASLDFLAEQLGPYI